MNLLGVVWKWLNDNGSGLAVLIAIAPILWVTYRYLSLKRLELHQRRFEIYHDLIKRLVERESPDAPKMLDRQTAVVYELKNFKEYYPVTRRILNGLKQDWTSSEYGPDNKRSRLFEQIDETIERIERKLK